MSSLFEKTEAKTFLNEGPLIRMMDPKEILPSPFGADVNPVATETDDTALRESIRANGVQISITVGRVKGVGTYRVVKGTRRHGLALELGIEKVPVELKEYDSLAEMREDAIRDNLERRQLSVTGKAKLAYRLWLSYESAGAKEKAARQGKSPRERAAIASGVSEGTLANYRAVMDGSDVGLISKMESEAISIDAAHRQMKRTFEDNLSQGLKKDAAVKVERVVEELSAVARILKALDGVTGRVVAARKALLGGNKADRVRGEKKMAAAAKAIADVMSGLALIDLHEALTEDVEATE